jgi:hypothetical protein
VAESGGDREYFESIDWAEASDDELFSFCHTGRYIHISLYHDKKIVRTLKETYRREWNIRDEEYCWFYDYSGELHSQSVNPLSRDFSVHQVRWSLLSRCRNIEQRLVCGTNTSLNRSDRALVASLEIYQSPR